MRAENIPLQYGQSHDSDKSKWLGLLLPRATDTGAPSLMVAGAWSLTVAIDDGQYHRDMADGIGGMF